MKEEWRPVVGYEGLYEVSNMGRVKSVKRTVWNNSRGCYRTVSERIMKPKDSIWGYLRVGLSKNGKEKWYMIHRLVATAFLENPQNLPEVNHIDEDKTNNNADNLEWCSSSYNLTYNGRAEKVGKKVAEKLRGRKQSEEHIKKRSKPIYSINKVSGLVLYWNSAHEASRVLRINQGNITRCCQGKQKTAKGYTFFYANANDDAE